MKTSDFVLRSLWYKPELQHFFASLGFYEVGQSLLFNKTEGNQVLLKSTLVIISTILGKSRNIDEKVIVVNCGYNMKNKLKTLAMNLETPSFAKELRINPRAYIHPHTVLGGYFRGAGYNQTEFQREEFETTLTD